MRLKQSFNSLSCAVFIIWIRSCLLLLYICNLYICIQSCNSEQHVYFQVFSVCDTFCGLIDMSLEDLLRFPEVFTIKCFHSFESRRIFSCGWLRFNRFLDGNYLLCNIQIVASNLTTRNGLKTDLKTLSGPRTDSAVFSSSSMAVTLLLTVFTAASSWLICWNVFFSCSKWDTMCGKRLSTHNVVSRLICGSCYKGVSYKNK